MSREKKMNISEERLKEALEKKSLTQRQLAENVDCSHEHLNRCIRDGQIATGLLYRIGEYLNLSPDYLSGQYTPNIDPDNDPVSKSLYDDLISFETQAIHNAQDKIDHYIRGVVLISGLTVDFYERLSRETKDELKKRIVKAVHDFHFELMVIDESTIGKGGFDNGKRKKKR